jgi:hypothetical protein
MHEENRRKFFMETNHDHIKLTASELSYLWTSYLADSMAVCVLQYFLVHMDDKDIKTLTAHALDLSKKHVDFIREIFTKERIQIPQGFTEDDVNLLVKRLFSDTFYLR